MNMDDDGFAKGYLFMMVCIGIAIIIMAGCVLVKTIQGSPIFYQN